MKIAIGSDHAGFALKQELADDLRRHGHTVEDMGTNNSESVDYPDYAAPVARAVAAGSAERGVLVCGSGVGVAIAANKIDGVRATLGYHPEEVALSRQHNDANVLAIGARFTQPAAAREYVRIFLQTPFDGGRHQRRVEKISQLERT